MAEKYPEFDPIRHSIVKKAVIAFPGISMTSADYPDCFEVYEYIHSVDGIDYCSIELVRVSGDTMAVVTDAGKYDVLVGPQFHLCLHNALRDMEQQMIKLVIAAGKRALGTDKDAEEQAGGSGGASTS